jgi:hypothetical protein
MSVRYLYRALPLSQRICSWIHCQNPIQRNIIRTKDGRMWHYGCLQSAKDTHYQCLECVATFDGTEVNFEEGSSGFGDDFRQQWKPQCPGCGANLRSLASQGGIEF